MAKLSILKGATSVLVRIFIQDSSSTTGAGLTGLVFNSGSLVCYRMRDDDGNAGATAITLATMTLGTWASGGFKEKDATNAPGWYEFGIPNNALATGSRSVSIHLKGAANMAPLPIEIELTGVDNQDGVRFGLTALPNAAAEAAGGLFTRGTGAGQIEQEDNGKVSINVKQWLRGTIPAVNVTGIPLVDATKWVGGTIPAVNVTGVPLIDLKYTLGTISPAAAGSVRADAVTGAVGSVTGNVGGNVVGNVNGSVVGSVASVTAAITLPTGEATVIATGTASAGTVNTITLASALGATNLVQGCRIKIISGTGAKQSRIIASYNNGTQVVTFDWPMTTAPDNTSVYAVTYDNAPSLDSSLKVSGVVLVDTLTTYSGNSVQTGNCFTRLGTPAGASVSADIAAAKVDTAAIKVQTDKMVYTVANQLDVNVIDWKGSAAPAMTGDAYARIGSAGVGLTNLGDTRIANLDAAVTTRMATFTLPTNFSSLSIDAAGRVKSQSNVQKNIALTKFQFLMKDSTNHAPVTGKTVTVTRSIDNGAQGAGTLSAVTEIGVGMYSVDFATGDLNGNVIVLRATAASCDDTFERLVTVP